MQRITNKIKSIVHPFIYPKGNVHPSYGKYVGWSCFSNFVISAESVMSTHSMLSVVGLASTELTISLNFIGKDIIGQMGGLWYINKVGEKADKEPVKFIKYSMAFEQSSVLLECATPLLPAYLFLPIAGLANTGKNVAATGMGAINAKIIQKLACEQTYEQINNPVHSPDTEDYKTIEDPTHKRTYNNIGEIYAKISVLNTMGSTMGMGLGLLIVSQVPDHATRLCIVPVLTAIRLYSYKKAVEDLL